MDQSYIQIGSLVRFLNATGGGRVARITNDTAWVEDEDGFEIPTLLRDCVVVEENDTFMPAYKPPVLLGKTKIKVETAEEKKEKEAVRSQFAKTSTPQPKPERPKASHTYVPASGEVNISLAYLPISEADFGRSPYEAYLINDSKYTVFFTYSSRAEQHEPWKLRAQGQLLPEENLFLDEVAPSELGQIDRLNIQLIAFAENPGVFKSSHSIEFRLDAKKLLKLSNFAPNDFFDDRAYILPLVEQSRTVDRAPLSIDEEALAQMLISTPAKDLPRQTKAQPASDPNAPLVIDLHIDELLDTTVGLDAKAILAYQVEQFNKVMQDHLKQRGKQIIFIHGKGDGVLRNRIISELKYRYKHCRYQDASFEQYSYGATQVTIG